MLIQPKQTSELIKVMLNSLLISLLALLPLVCFASPAVSDTETSANTNNGTIVFFREKKAKGAAIRFSINDHAGAVIGSLSNGTVIRKELAPQEYTFTVRSPSVDGQDSITVKVTPGTTIYIKGEILWGWPAGRPKFTLTPESEAQSFVSKLE